MVERGAGVGATAPRTSTSAPPVTAEARRATRFRIGTVTAVQGHGGFHMLQAAIAFFVIAIIAAVFGFTGIAAGAAGIAKIAFYVFVVIAIVSLVAGLLRR